LACSVCADLCDLHLVGRLRLGGTGRSRLREDLVDVRHFHVVEHAARHGVPVESRLRASHLIHLHIAL
jgi:hypothetical protein